MKLAPTSLAISILLFAIMLCVDAVADDVSDQAVNQPDLEYFAGSWKMKGRFRFGAAQDWLGTKSHLSAKLMLDGKAVVREISAPQIGLKAIDTISVDPASGVIQYLYQTNREPNALVFEGVCADDKCLQLEMIRICGPNAQDDCDARTTISVETDNRFVARDFQNTATKEYMSREVVYERE